MASPGPTQQDGDQSSPVLQGSKLSLQGYNTLLISYIDKDGTQSGSTETETTSSSQPEGKKKRGAQPKRKREPAPKKPKKSQSPAATPPPPGPEKKKQAAKKPKKAAAPTTAKGKKARSNSEISASQLSQSEPADASNLRTSSTLPIMMPPTATNSIHAIEATGNEFDITFSKRSTDEDMDELGGDIDISMWLNSASTAMAPTPGSVQQSSLSPSTVDFDKEMDFFSSPATIPALNQKTPSVVPLSPSPSTFPVVDDAVVFYLCYSLYDN